MPDTTPPELLALIARFEANRDAYRAGTYNETMVRREFIDPLLRLLGWDVDNTKGYAEAYKEVVHEDAVRVGRSTKAPDYSLRIGGQRKLFVEAKKPAVNIKDDVAPAYQVRRYAWSAKLPLSILTDFEEFAVYDCTNQPDQKDDASHSRIMYLRYEQYPDKWGDLLDLFSPDAIMRGSFDKFAQSSKRKRGTAEVDDAFLQEISQWRDELARNIALRNPGVTTRQLNYAVQATIDRLIFLRIAEDRGIEGYGRLRDAAQGKEIYAELGRLFQLADAKYNSGLFHFKPEKGRSEAPDTFTLNLTIDDKVLKGIIRRLYYPDSPYQFDVIPADILGQVYEQFLGKVIRLTAGGQAKVEEKPEVKKAGGVFYTPTYIVDYIVAQTVGKLLEGRKPGPKGDASKLRVLDPACGSGSFLLGAYQYLLDWHLEQYRAEADKWARGKEPTLYQNERGDWKLTITERKRILLNNIYGVDIDPQAVEVTKLSLLLKVMEGETEASLGTQLRLLPERVLPDLSANILCGNSLIGPDFYEGQQLSLGLLDEEEMYRINVFDWAAAFPTIVPWGGFDAVIGNPPWISLSGKFGNDILSSNELGYLIMRYKGNTYMPNMYEYFVAKGLELTKKSGFFSFVVPDRLGFNSQFTSLRKRILTDFTINSLIYKVPFPGITADVLVFVLQNIVPDAQHLVNVSSYEAKTMPIPQMSYCTHPDYVFEFFENDDVMQVVLKIESHKKVRRLSEFCNTTSGFGGKSKLITEQQQSGSQIEVLKGDSILRYQTRKSYWFEFVRENITGRTTDRQKLGAIPKILLRKTGDTIIATLDETGFYPEQSLYFLYNNQTHLDFKFFLGVLNSKLMTFYYRARALTNRDSIAQVKKVDLDKLPLLFMDVLNAQDQSQYEQMVGFVDSMLALHKRLASAPTAHEKTILQRQISATDRQIDQLVYQLYGLTDEEIAIVERVGLKS